MIEYILTPTYTAKNILLRMNFVYGLLLMMSINLFSAPTSPTSMRFKRISVEDGLSQSTVFCILQDTEGFMWFGTRSGGLNRYDGYTFTVYKNNPNDPNSLSNNEVISLFEDHNKQLWVGTRKGGLNKYNPKTESFIQYKQSNDSTGLSGSTVNVIFEDSKNQLWIGTSNGLNLLQNGIFYKNRIPGIVNEHITAIDEDEDGNLYITDKSGLFVYNKKTNSTNYYKSNDINEEANSSNYSIPFLVDSKQQKWIGSSVGLSMFTNNNTFTSFGELAQEIDFPTSEVRQILEDRKGNLWIGTILGLYKYDPQNNSISHFQKDENDPLSLSHNSIYSIYEDKSGIIWIGTWGGGVNMLTDKLLKFEKYSHQSHNSKSLSNNVVSSFAEDENGIWIGTELGGLNYYSYQTKQFNNIQSSPSNPRSLSNNHIKTLLYNSNHFLWVGTYGGGLNKMNVTTGNCEHYLPGKKVFSLCETRDKKIWIGTLDGLYLFNPENNTLKRYENDPDDPKSLSHNFVSILFLSSNQTLWIGTKEAGLMKYNENTDDFDRFKNIANDTSSLLSNYVISINEDSNNNLLIGTNNGLNIYNPINQTFLEVKIPRLPDKNINSIECDAQNNYWLATNKGITKYHKGTPVINYDVNDGLQSNEFSRNASFKSKNGRFYFGGINGFNAFSPEIMPINTDTPAIVITHFRISNQIVKAGEKKSPLDLPISTTKEITLTHNQADFSFEFVALNFIAPEKNQYAYKLEGYNDDWIYSGKQRVATYTNIKPGRYVFKIIGSNNDNVWNTKGVSVKIRILPPFWKTPFAYILYVILLFTLLLLLKRLLTYRIEQQNMLDNERLEKQRIEELNQLKLRFFTNVAHEFRTPLTLISGPISQLETNPSNTETQQYLIHIVQNNVKRLLHLVNELMDFRKAENEKLKLRISNSNLSLFTDNLVKCFSQNAEEKNIALSYTCVLNEKTDFWFDKGILDKVLFNLLSNAFKYTPKNGKIMVELKVENDLAIIDVSDTGTGIAEDEINKIFDRFYQVEGKHANLMGTGIGLAFAKRLIETHNGSIHVISQPNKGSVFTIKLPINKAAYPQHLIVETNEENFVKQTPASELHVLHEQTDTTQNNSKQKLLIVEDNDELRSFLSQHFKAFKVLTAANGKQGLEIAFKEIPDVIISDIMMPEMDGLEMCEKIKNQFVTSHIPVILLSAKTETYQKIEGLETGADVYIEKPFDLAFLEATIKNILAQRKKLRKRYANDPNVDVEVNNLSVHDKKFIDKVNQLIKTQVANPDFSVETLANDLGLSRSQLFRKFKAFYEISPSETIRIARLELAKKYILERNFNINEISDRVGFKNTTHFITSFKKHFGITPNEYLKK